MVHFHISNDQRLAIRNCEIECPNGGRIIYPDYSFGTCKCLCPASTYGNYCQFVLLTDSNLKDILKRYS
ncbi:hypothetical protein Ciccas_014443 [Cichlidogyrus casuarinus]|uniref:EGF-like domain-containing protein n=1 Tax=Cichlidogyrus casuarinus TaxID=1844966 RepID=A0ABD2PI90_9PLAT